MHLTVVRYRLLLPVKTSISIFLNLYEITSLLNGMIVFASGYMGVPSVPVTIPSVGQAAYHSLGGFSHSFSPVASPSDSLHASFASGLSKPEHMFDVRLYLRLKAIL